MLAAGRTGRNAECMKRWPSSLATLVGNSRELGSLSERALDPPTKLEFHWQRYVFFSSGLRLRREEETSRRQSRWEMI